MKQVERSMAYDVIRVVALMMIVMVHVSAYIVIFFPDVEGVEWLVGNIFNGVARAGVPMFVMLSGALLLNEDKPLDTKKFYKRNLLTMVLLTVGWLVAYGIFYAVLLPLFEGKPIVVTDFWLFLASFKGSDYPHLWYMLMVIGMYLMIPILRLFVKRENKPYIIGIIIASLIVEFGAGTLNFFTRSYDVTVSSMLGKIHLEPVTGFIGMLLLGWYLSEYTLKKKTTAVLLGAGAVMVTISTIMVFSMIEAIPEIRDYVYEALTLPAFIYGAAVFSLCQMLCRGKKSKGKILAKFSDCSFGIYLIHVAMLEIFVRYILPYESFGMGKPFAYIIILYAFTLSTSFVIVYFAGHIKGVRRIFFNR